MSCWRRCGGSRTAGPTARSTSTCPGCAASSARPPPSRATCTASGGGAGGRLKPRRGGAGTGIAAAGLVSRRIVLLTLATTSLVVLAFLVPLLFLVRDVADAREIVAGQREAQTVGGRGRDTDGRRGGACQQVNGTSGRQTTVFQPGGRCWAPPRPGTRPDRIAASPGGRRPRRGGPVASAVFTPVVLDSGTAVVRTFVPGRRADPRRGPGLDRAGAARRHAPAGRRRAGRVLGRSMVRPLLSVAATADALRGGDLTARATPADPPEVRRIAGALNGLAERITDLLQAEREAAADLSHRLRTPLTALRLDAEGLRQPEEAERMLGAVAALERMVSHVIAQARRPGERRADRVTDAAAVVRERVAFWSALAEEQERPVGGKVPDVPVPVPLGADELAAAVDALLGKLRAHPGGVRVLGGRGRRPGAGAGGAGHRPRDRRPGAAGPGPVRRVVHRARAGHRAAYRRSGGGPARPVRREPVRAACVVWLGPPPDGGSG